VTLYFLYILVLISLLILRYAFNLLMAFDRLLLKGLLTYLLTYLFTYLLTCVTPLVAAKARLPMEQMTSCLERRSVWYGNVRPT